MNRCVVGLQWGDEGKGKIVDILSEEANLVVRYSGGANAGHSVVRKKGEKAFALHLLPSGILRDNVESIIANGVVLDAEIILGEIETLKSRDVSVEGKLKISGRAHMVMPYHKLQDQLKEESLGKAKIGTTLRGIGPCYGDKVARSSAIRVADLLKLDQLEARLEKISEEKTKYFKGMYGWEGTVDAAELFKLCKAWAVDLAPFIVDTTELLHKAIDANKDILFEGAQGTLLDLDHGTFPFVTSSNASAVGISAATGVPAKKIESYVGVAKVYTSRVGAGPFPTEQDNEIGEYIRVKGHEFGTTTGRPRRCGWFDAVSVDYSIRIGGIDELAVLHLDTLSGLKELKICVAYDHNGTRLDFFPAEGDVLEAVTCEYITLDGFDDDLTSITKFDDLPEKAKAYIYKLEEILKTPIKMVGVGPGRDQTLYR